jgi:acetyl coenzyme A synthetase (ADP forming)-like protein
MPKQPVSPPKATEVILKDGQNLRVRHISPKDKAHVKRFFNKISPAMSYLRWHYAKTGTTDEEAAHFAEAVLPERCIFVATMGEGRREHIVAMGGYDATKDMKSADVTFLVSGDFQSKGIGTVLLEKLAETAGHYRIKEFTARVLPENTNMLRMFEESGFISEKRFEDGAYDVSINLADQEEFAKRQERREHIARTAGVRSFLYPHSVAVIGASRDHDSIGGGLFHNLLESSFNGPVFPINPMTTSVAGVLAYPSVLEVPSDVDLAVIVVPAASVLDVIDECGQKGVRSVVIISVGFGEAGPEGRERERKLKEKTVSYGIRVIGPNCLGILNSDPTVQLNATFAPASPPAGNLSIGTQSGALGLALLDYARNVNLGIADFVSIGNRIDISNNDLLEFWEEDPTTDVILLYVESFGNPARFTRIARRVSRKKPIIAVKSGRSEAGARAASSHTGALAAADVGTDALFRRAGVIRVNTIDEMFGVSAVLAYQPLPKGPRVGILTNAGGPGVLVADACEGLGLKIPALNENTKRKLASFLPEEAALSNPVDMVASAPADSYRKALSILLEDEDIDAIILIYIPPLITKPEDVAKAIIDVVTDYEGGKPVLANFMMSAGSMPDLKIGEGRYVPSYVFPESAAQALAHAYHYSQFRQDPEGLIPVFEDIKSNSIRDDFFMNHAISEQATWLLPEVVSDLLARYGIPVIDTRIARSAEEAASVAEELGFPVVMKVRSDTITHKTDVGGIELGLTDAKDVEKAYIRMMKRLDAAGLTDQISDVIVQPMEQNAQEVIIGMTHSDVFGPLLMVGLGGIHVELQKDVAFSLHPLTDTDADWMLNQLKGLPLLKGWRGSPKRDIAALKDVLMRFSVMIEDFPEIKEVEINPLMVKSKGEGSVAVDARIRMQAHTPGGLRDL